MRGTNTSELHTAPFMIADSSHHHHHHHHSSSHISRRFPFTPPPHHSSAVVQRLRPLLLLPFLLALPHGVPALSAATNNNTSTNANTFQSASHQQQQHKYKLEQLLLDHCDRFRDFEPGIAEDLLPWYDEYGISEELMDRMLATRTLRARVPGLPLAVRGGRLFVIKGGSQSISRVMPWQAENIVVYAHVLSRLVTRWGAALPDVEFVVETMDTPFQDLGTAGEGQGAEGMEGGRADGGSDAPGGVWGQPHGRLPVMRHCKTASSPDITIPTFHFYTLNFDDRFLAAIDRINAEHPWGSRLGQAYAGGTGYHREQRVPSTTRQWDGVHRGEVVRHVRSAFSSYLATELAHPNISYTEGGTPMEQWARFKMVMNVDGIACSSRLWQLLALGSVVLREQSGYFAFYDKLLRKFHHFVPFWSHRPREVLWAYRWVAANGAAAADIAARGQRFAAQYLNREALECYWALLLRQYARLLRFTPGERRGWGGEEQEEGEERGMQEEGEEGQEEEEGKGPAAGPGEKGEAAVGQRQQRRARTLQKQGRDLEQRGGGKEGGEESGRGQVRQLELVPIEEWLAAQDGRVRGWAPTRVADRVQALNLLPPERTSRPLSPP